MLLQLFKLEDRPEAIELYFAQAYQKACRAMQGISSKDTPGTSGGAGRSGLQAIAKAAAAGLATATVTDVADDILNFPTIPQLPVVEKSEGLPVNIACVLNQENVSAMILSDLAYTVGKTWDICKHLMSMIKTKLPAKATKLVEAQVQTLEPKSAKTVPKQRVNKIKTFQELFEMLENLLKLGTEDDIPSKEHALLAKTFQKSVQQFLCHANFSLDADKNKQYATLRQNLAKHITKVEEAFVYQRSKGHSPETRSVLSEVRERLGSHGSRSEGQKPSIHHSMKHLIALMEKEVPAAGILAFVNRLTTQMFSL